MEKKRFLIKSEVQGQPVRVGENDLNQAVLSTIFNIVPSTITLVSETSHDVETADEAGDFRYWNMNRNEVWCCKGVPLYKGKCSSTLSFKRKSSPASTVVGHSCVASASGTGKSKRARTAMVNVEVCHIERRGKKPKITPSSTFRMQGLSDGETLSTLSAKIADEAFNGKEVVLLDARNLQHMDTPSTRCKL